jgi:pyruvate dehydrogenase E1 component
MSALPNDLRTFALNDSDSQETREWMDALSAVIQAEGPERAHFLLEQLLEHARENSIDMPFSANTGYVHRDRPRRALPRQY